MGKLCRARPQWGQDFSKQQRERRSMPGSKSSIGKAMEARTWLTGGGVHGGHKAGNKFRHGHKNQHVGQRI